MVASAENTRLTAGTWSAVKIAAVYAGISAIWIVGSDLAFEAMGVGRTEYEIGKGLGFVLVTAALLVWLIRHEAGRLVDAQIALSRANGALEALAEGIRNMARAETDDDVFAAACQALARQKGYDVAWVGRARQDDAQGIERLAVAGPARGFLDAIKVDRSEGPYGQGPTGRAIRSGATQVLTRVRPEDYPGPWRDQLRAWGIRSAIAVPVPLDEERPVVLTVYSRANEAFRQAERQAIEALADNLGEALGRRRAKHRVKRAEAREVETLRDLEYVLQKTVRALTRTIERRDPYIGGHQEHVADLLCRMATRLNMTADQIEGLRLGALVHDIGKIAVPAEILSKPTRPSAAEFEIIKTHPAVGGEILQGIRFPWPIREMVLQHHERLDGSGYPAELAGDDIAYEAQLLAVADVVEAMTARRPYRRGRTLDEAVDEIKRGRGVLYNAEAVDACLAVIDAGEFTPAE